MSNVPLADRILQYGLTEVFTPPEAEVDVLFVHGLNGHPYNTWATHKPQIYWPADLLPLAVQDQKCRILCYGYDANVTAFTDGVSKDKIHNHAEHLASRLVANRALRRALERPIIFVCHSLGGLVVKRCLIYSESLRHSHTERLRSIYVSTYGILFLGTPHNGSDLAKWGTLLERISSAVLPKKFFDSSPQLVQALKTNNETLQNINRLFIEIIGRFHIYFFHESKPMDLKGTRDFVVDEDSAAPVIEGVERMGIERDHSHMCKFEDENAPGYDVVAEAIQRYAEEAPSIIKARWEEEKQIRDFTKQGAAREMLGSDSALVPGPASTADNSAQPSRPISAVNSTTSMQLIEQQAVDNRPPEEERGLRLVAPLGFRPNSRFVGFELELVELHKKLHNRKRMDIGSCSVLVWGQPGCGKTYLARQYLYNHRSEYPSGAFWVDCKSERSRLTSYWDIGVSIGAFDGNEDSTDRTDAPDAFVDRVRNQLESKRGWLLIFDGLILENDEEIEDFRRFLPDKNGNSIIFTSPDRTLAKRHFLLDPSAIKVHPMNRDEACLLLYQTLGIEKPNTVQRSKALELVKDHQCLPLAVYAAAHVLIETGRSLESYSHGISDARLSSPFLTIVEALQKKFHVEAVNLITILSFFSHYVPVALIRYGSKSLSDFQRSILSPKRTDGSRKDLDSTISILLRSGLLERTLQSYPLTTPGNSSPDESRVLKKIDNGQLYVSAAQTLQNALVLSRESQSGSVAKVAERTFESDRSSTSSGTSTIDVLRMHSVVQRVIRDDLKDRQTTTNRPENEEYWWWLTVAVHLFCQSFTTANDRIKSTSGRGLIRDYREYDTQAVRLHSFFPKASKDASTELRKSRHHLRETLRVIRREIHTQSPSHYSDNSGRLFQGSIFERSSSTSEFGTHSSDSDLDRVSTWSLDPSRPASESPTAMQSQTHLSSEPHWNYDMDEAVLSDSDSEHEESDTTEIPNQILVEHSRRDSILRQILHDKPQQGQKHKDLGEWKPLWASATVSHPDVRVSGAGRPSRGSSSERPARATSGSSEAEAALAAVHRSSPPVSRGGRIRSPSREHTEYRQPLAPKTTNTKLSPLAAEFQLGQVVDRKSVSDKRYHARHISSSPRLIQAILNSQSRSSGQVPLQSPPVYHVDPVNVFTGQVTSKPAGNFGSVLSTITNTIPTGYTSVPMSRNVSEDTNITAAPTTQLSENQLNPSSAQIRDAFSDTYLTNRDLYERSQSLTRFQAYPYPPPQFLQTQEIEFGQLGEWAASETGLTPITPVFPSSIAIMDENHPPDAAALQFGAMEPIGIEEARRRASMARERSADRGRRGAEEKNATQ